VSVDNHNVPNYVQVEENARFTVSFHPQEPKPHVVSVKFNAEHVPGEFQTSIISGKLLTCVNYHHTSGSPMTSPAFRPAAQQPVQSSPVPVVPVVQSSKPTTVNQPDVSIHGDGLKQSTVGQPASFFVGVKGRENPECNVIVTGMITQVYSDWVCTVTR